MHDTQLAEHLETQLCPPGVRVFPVQSQSWIDACINCGCEGKVTVKASKTDFLFITEAGWDKLVNLGAGSVTGAHLVQVLQYVIALYEVGYGLKVGGSYAGLGRETNETLEGYAEHEVWGDRPATMFLSPP